MRPHSSIILVIYYPSQLFQFLLFLLLPLFSTLPAPRRDRRKLPFFSAYPNLSFPKIKTPSLRKEKDDEFSSLFQNEPEYKFDSFIVECFICQEDKKPYETIQSFEASLDNIEINDSHELNVVGAMVDDVVVLRGGFDEDKADLKIVSEEEIVESADSDDEVEDTTEIAHAY